MTHQAGILEARLERLERRCRRLTIGVVALAGVLATACLSSAVRGDPDVLHANQLILHRNDGSEGIVMFGELGTSDSRWNCSAIYMHGAKGSASGGWTVGRVRDEGGLEQGYADFHIGAGDSESAGAGLTLWTNERQSCVRVEGGLQRANLEAEADRTSLRFIDVDPDDVEEEDGDTMRLSLELEDGVPALRAFDEFAHPAFEVPEPER